MTIIQAVYVFLGIFTLALGTLGIFLPILPTTPFFLATLFFFTKGSNRLRKWFVNSRVYEKHLKSFVLTKAMTVSAKVKTLILLTILFAIPLIVMETLCIKIVIMGVLLVHYLMIIFKVKSMSKADLQEALMKMENEDERKT